jgi:peptide/nickel transport system substrate-binding protein
MSKVGWLLLMIIIFGGCVSPVGYRKTDASPKIGANITAQVLTSPANTPVTARTSNNRLIFGMKQPVTTLDPLRAVQYGDIRLNHLVAQQLVAPDMNGNFVGVLAEKWAVSPDGKEWVFDLRKGVHFHNGMEMIADDVRWIFDRIEDPKTQSNLRTVFAGMNLHTSVINRYQVRFQMDSGMGSFLSYLSLLNRAAIIHRDSYDENGKVLKIIGTGPFQMGPYINGQYYILNKFPDYWKRGEPLLDEVELRVIPDANSRYEQLKAGTIDMTEELPFSQVKRMLNDPDPEIILDLHYINSDERLVMNQRRLPFSNKNSRLAVMNAIDREIYNQAIFHGLGQVHNQPFSFNDPWYLDYPIPKANLVQAKKYFEASGNSKGTSVEFLITPDQSDRAEIIRMMLAEVGFIVKIKAVQPAEWNSLGMAYQYDLLLGTMSGVFDPDRPYGYLSGKSGSNWLVGGYDSPEMNNLIEAGRSEINIEKRKETYKKILELVEKDAATMYLTGLPWVEAWRSYVSGYRSGNAPVLMWMDASEGLNKASILP